MPKDGLRPPKTTSKKVSDSSDYCLPHDTIEEAIVSPKEVKITHSALGKLISTVGTRKPETGGLLLGSRHDNIIRKFVFDEWGSSTRASYDPDPSKLNPIIKHEWRENRLALVGWTHSHPWGASRLSGDYGRNTGDIGFLHAIFAAMPSIQTFFVPIVFSSAEGALTLNPYIVERGNIERYQIGRFAPIPDSEAPDPWIYEPKSVNPQISHNLEDEAPASKVQSSTETEENSHV